MSQSSRQEPKAAEDSDTILTVDNLQTVFHTDKETVRAIEGIDFSVEKGETVGIVGESGSGKSVTARSIMGLVDAPGVIAEDSSIRFKGRELTGLSEEEYREVRGNGVAMVFQDPLSSLNPVYTVGNQIKETLREHQGLRGAEANEEAIDLLEAVSIPDARRRVNEYPHQFSGGMRQRAVIAMALACNPDLLICDEPTTALDVTIQAQILELLDEIQAERDLSIIFITHDMGVIAEVSDRVNVMYAGEIVETGPVHAIFDDPKHPYTQGLLQSIPGRHPGEAYLRTIEGDVPTPNEEPTDCRFHPRCPEKFEECEQIHPVSVPSESGATDHQAACLLYPEDVTRTDALERHQLERRQSTGVDDSRLAAEDTEDTHE